MGFDLNKMKLKLIAAVLFCEKNALIIDTGGLQPLHAQITHLA